MCVCVTEKRFVCVCVCVCERERERERDNIRFTQAEAIRACRTTDEFG